MLRPGQPGIEGKRAGVGKAVQHPRASAQFRRCPAVIFLIQEESRLLSVFYVHVVAHAVLHDLHLRVKRFADKALDALHALLLAHLRVTPLVHAADMDAVRLHQLLQDINDHPLEPVDPKRQGFHDQHVRELIHHKPGQKVRLPEDHAAARDIIHDLLPVLPRILHPHAEKRLVHLGIPVSCHHTDGQLRIAVDKSPSQGIPVKIMDEHDIPLRKAPHNTFHFIIIDPGTALL